MKKSIKASVGAAMLALMLAATTACASDDAGQSTPSSDSGASEFETVNPGVLTIVTSSDLTPFAFIKDNEWGGVDVGLAEHVAKELGLEVTITAQEFDTLIPLVASGQADMTMGSLADTDERRESVAFTLPQVIGNNSLIVPEDSKISNEDDVAGKRIGILQSSQALEYATEYWTDSDIVTYPNNNAARLALSGGSLDGLLLDPESGKRFTEQFPLKNVLSAVNPDDRGGAWILNKKANNLRVAINEQLRIALEDGTIQETLEEWKPSDPSEPVIDWLEDYYAAHPSDKYSEE